MLKAAIPRTVQHAAAVATSVGPYPFRNLCIHPRQESLQAAVPQVRFMCHCFPVHRVGNAQTVRQRLQKRTETHQVA